MDKDILLAEHNKMIEDLSADKIIRCPHCAKDIKPLHSMDARIKVVVGTPSMGHIEPQVFDRFIDWAMYLKELEYKYPFKFIFSSMGDVLTPWARERIAEHALDAKADYLLFVDDDMMFPMEIFEMLFKHNVDVVVPLMFMRNYPHSPVIYRIKKGYDKQVHQEYYLTELITDYPPDTLLKVDATGMGICLIKLDILHKIPKTWFMNTQGTGEDVYFTQRATDAGFGVYVDTSIHNIIHLGDRKKVDEAYYKEVHKIGKTAS